jgi:hypothetical protein
MLGAALVWRVLAVAHVVHARPLPGIATPLAIALAIWELSRIAATVRHVARRRQRRRHFRFSCELPAVVATEAGSIQTATIADLSLAGLSLEADNRIEPGSQIKLATTVATVAGPYRSISIEAVVRSCRPVGDRAWRLGVEITKMDEESERELVTFCHVVYPWSQLRPHADVAAPIPHVALAPIVVPHRPQLPARSRPQLLEALRHEVKALERSSRPTLPTREMSLLEALRREVAEVEHTAHEASRRPEPQRPGRRQESEKTTF